MKLGVSLLKLKPIHRKKRPVMAIAK